MAGRAVTDLQQTAVAGGWATPHPLQVLIVDDDPLIRETLAHIITALGGGDVTQAAGGYEAITLVTREPERFDLVFCDLQMPGSDGLDVLNFCAASGMQGNVVLMSGSGEENLRKAEDAAKDGRAALACTMAKPFAVSEIKSLLARFRRGG